MKDHLHLSFRTMIITIHIHTTKICFKMFFKKSTFLADLQESKKICAILQQDLTQKKGFYYYAVEII
jgi:hypothetical protein